MNFLGWRTDTELRKIMTDRGASNQIRQRAAYELYKRQWPVCSVPGCRGIGEETWATVPVCCNCKDTLTTQQLNYYAEMIVAEDRTLIYRLAHKMPWRLKTDWRRDLSG